jgi:FAD dependent oxidoreductase
VHGDDHRVLVFAGFLYQIGHHETAAIGIDRLPAGGSGRPATRRLGQRRRGDGRLLEGTNRGLSRDCRVVANDRSGELEAAEPGTRSRRRRASHTACLGVDAAHRRRRRVDGIVFKSKEGRLAIRAKVTIDFTGDGDIFHRAGAVSDSDITRCGSAVPEGDLSQHGSPQMARGIQYARRHAGQENA